MSHIERMDSEATLIGKMELPEDCPEGHYIAPHIYELESISQLQREVFGPILHIVRYKTDELDKALAEINATGYGLTMGVHSRIEGFSREIFAKTRIGNTYINRNMVGSVVGVNPFGGQGLSGTGFKAGGPHYLLRFSNLWESAAVDGDIVESNGSKPNLGNDTETILHDARDAQWRWNLLGGAQRADILQKILDDMSGDVVTEETKPQIRSLLDEARTQFGKPVELPGPTGETNTLTLHGRGVFLICSNQKDSERVLLLQTIAALAAGNAVLIGSAEDQEKSR